MNKALSLRNQLECGVDQLVSEGTPAISATMLDPMLQLLELLVKWNRVHNLTAVRDPVKMVGRHLLDSLIMSRWLPSVTENDKSIVDVIDIGSGAGLPVLPLAIIRPDLRFMSIECVGKKTRFQQQVLLELNISNVQLVQDRVENVTSVGRLVLSRAFTAPIDFLRIAYPLCDKDGRVVIMLGHSEHLPDSVSPDYELEELVKVRVPGSETTRHVAVCRRRER